MAYVPTGLRNTSGFGSFEDYKSYLAGEKPLLQTGGADLGSDSTGGGGPSLPQPSTQAPNEPGTPTSSSFRAAEPGASGLLNPLKEGLTATSSELQNIGRTFMGAAGPSISPEQVNYKGTIDETVKTGNLDPAKALLGREYTGPSGLEATDIASLTEKAGGLEAQAKAAATGAGVQNLYRMQGLTPGEARYEAGKTYGDFGYRQEARGIAGAAGMMTPMIQKETKAAEEYAGRRADEEAAVASAARGYTVGQKSKIQEELESAAAAKNAESQKTMDIYGQLQETGDRALLPLDMQNQFNETPAQQKRAQAEGEWNAINSQYWPIAKYDPLPMTIGGHGLERYGQPGDDFLGDQLSGWRPEGFSAESNLRGPNNRQTRQMLRERQRALEEKFSPGNRRTLRGKNDTRGEFSDVAPLYDYENSPTGFPEQPWESPDVRNYVDLDPGIQATMENLASGEQRLTYNRLSEILDQADRLAESGEPFRAAQLVADIEGYIVEEDRRVADSASKTNAKADEWSTKVGKMRKLYNKRKNSAMWGDVLGGYLLAMGAPLLAPPLLVPGATMVGQSANIKVRAPKEK